MKLLLSLCTMLACAGCASEGPPRTVEVPIPVRTPCRVEVPVCGPYAMDRVSEGDRLIVKGRAALAEVDQRAACEVRLRAALKGCME